MRLWRLFLLACFVGAASFGWSSPALSAAEQKAFTQAARELGFDMHQFRKTLAEDQVEGLWMVVSGVRAEFELIEAWLRQLEDLIRSATEGEMDSLKQVLRKLHAKVQRFKAKFVKLMPAIQRIAERYPREWQTRGINSKSLAKWADEAWRRSVGIHYDPKDYELVPGVGLEPT